MDRAALIAELQAQDSLQPAALISHRRDKTHGIAFLLGENLSKTWQSGDLIIFWPNGDQTDINADDQVDYLVALWSL